MYDEGADGAGAAPALGGVGKKMNLEGLIPLILLVIIGIASLNYFGIVDVPFLPKGTTRVQMLFIGEPSIFEKNSFDNMSYFLSYRVRGADTFSNAASEELHQYDIVFLDQSQVSDKSISAALGDALQKYVQKGGKLVIVMNSAIYQSVGFNGYTAADVVGWKAMLGNMVPAECVPGADGIPTCRTGQEIPIVGRVWRQDYDHPIMQGIDIAPPMGDAPLRLTTLGIQANEGARTIAYIKAENTSQTYPAILEKKNFGLGLFGTVVYFNYDPGLTQGILKNTINYLK